jgi:hypothetical protein
VSGLGPRRLDWLTAWVAAGLLSGSTGPALLKGPAATVLILRLETVMDFDRPDQQGSSVSDFLNGAKHANIRVL